MLHTVDVQPETSRLNGLSPESLKDLYYKMVLTRAFEEAAFQQYSLGKVHGTMHLAVGEEATGIGGTAGLRADDYIVSTHRGHAHAIGKGQDVREMMAELLGKENGVCRGRGGSMHMADVTLGSLGANGVVGGGLPLSVGAGLALKLRNEDRVVLCFFGDGASNEGNFHESLNMASAWKLPVIFLCENNQYGMSMPVRKGMNAASIADRAVGYGIPGTQVDGMDVLAVREAVREAAAHARAGNGPVLIEAITYRYLGHSKSDKQLYRTKEEVEEWKKKDAIKRLELSLIEQGMLTQAEVEALQARAEAAIEEAIAYGDAGTEPPVEHLTDDVYLEEPEVLAAPNKVAPAWARATFGANVQVNPPAGTREITYSEALREAMAQALASDAKVFLLGEDIGVYGGAFGVTKDLVEEFGPDRVRDTPISENAIVGAAVGSAVLGLRPVAEMQFMDFITLGMEQTVLQAAKIRYMFGGKASVPMVVRLPAGSGTGAAAQHCESLESWFLSVPGLKVAAPTTPYEAKGMLLAAIADNNPVLFVENKLLYKSRGPVPVDPYVVPLGQAAVRRTADSGSRRVTVVGTQIMTHRSLEAAKTLAGEGIELEVIDLRSLKPYDSETIIQSVKKTGRLLVVHEAPLIGGFGGEIAAMVAQSPAFAYLEAPIVRLGGADVPIPYNPKLEKAAVPQIDNIIATARKLANYEI
ncbi:MAG: dehydrogenase E1 component subunit alpha/beta [Anaerolineae bacterium]|jgi:pyruvate dehydrogenase E1 component alpha subunit|nr:dehydrogenase E1 component subunit alpha/beta [Anaerolineae bacterium]